MSLKAYRAKRKLTKTPEPRGHKVSHPGALQYVIQKHAARRLHYDFRLELDGVLKSWAIPKGPSLDPSVKRLAIEVEDHPLEYGSFEGVIPEGNYGAGKVEIWDRGTYGLAEQGLSRKEQEKRLRDGLRAGEIKFFLDGEKLKGEFALVRISKEDEDKKQWLLIKKKDQYQAHAEIIPEKVDVLQKASKTAMPHHLSPMLAFLVDEPFDKDDWIFEIKWDGYRAIAEVSGKGVQVYSRNFISFNEKFPSIVKALGKLQEKAIFDGEIVVLDQKGRSQFQLLQNYLNSQGGEGTLRYCIFDLLYYQDRDLRSLPLVERKELLKKVLKDMDSPLIAYSDYVQKQGIEFFKAASKLSLEGIMAKEGSSPYQSKRSRSWLKIKIHQSQEVVIGGFTKPRGSRKRFGALIIGVYKNGKLVYSGHVGGGFDQKTLEAVYQQLEPLITAKCPFAVLPPENMPATWVKPQLVCEVAFQEWTKEGMMRQPIFKGLRVDKSPKSVAKEEPNEQTSLQAIATHSEKVFWPKEGYTKGDLLNYYQEVSPYLLPFLKDRPAVLVRFPDGIEGKSFFQKEAPSYAPEWVKTVSIQHTGKTVHYILVQDLPSLLFTVNLGAIEIHHFLSRYTELDYPDYLVLDLDPVDLPFDAVVEVAQAAHKFLDHLGLDQGCKTSGKRGLHIYLPLGAKYEYKTVTEFAELLANFIHLSLPKLTSLERDPQKRKKRVYIDYLQNGKTKTVVAPYIVRAVEGAVVSTPLEWKEVKKGLDPTAFTIKTILPRLKKKGELFQEQLKQGIDIEACLKKLEKMRKNRILGSQATE